MLRCKWLLTKRDVNRATTKLKQCGFFIVAGERGERQLREAKRQMKLSRQTSVGVWNDKLASNKPEYTFETRAPFSLCLYTGWFKKKKEKKRSTVSLITKKKNSKTGGKNCMELKVVEEKTSSFVSSSCIYLSLNRSKRFRAINAIGGGNSNFNRRDNRLAVYKSGDK